MSQRIEDYGFIADMRTVALVGRDGSMDWLCLPRIDSPACFAALLGTEEHGRWRLAPRGAAARVSRRYRRNSLVLETSFELPEGAITLVDFLTPAQVGEGLNVVRIVRGDRGRVDVEMELILRFEYGAFVPWVRRHPFGLTAIAGPDAIAIRTPVELTGRDYRTYASFCVGEGETVPFVMTWHQSHLPPPPPSDALDLMVRTEEWWLQWSQRYRYQGPYQDLAHRSLTVLKGLTNSTTGGIAAAATTSLPEELGGMRNWDYRYCWLRDATFTLYALLASGYVEEAAEWQRWLLRAAAGKPADLQIMYGVAGERLLIESEIPWLPGYAGSTPVRIGNAAHSQFQLDVLGEVMDAFHVAGVHGIEVGDDARRFQRELIDFLEQVWDEPDDGIWEVRSGRQHFTHSKVMAWLALDRAVKSAAHLGSDAPVERWKTLRNRIHAEVCAKGFDQEKRSFVQYYGGKDLDAALLMIPLVGFLPPNDPRVLGTIEAVQRELSTHGIVRRYSRPGVTDGVAGADAPFLACSFWLADCLAMTGRAAEARALLDRLAGLANDLGLFSEEYDPVAGRMLGNYPQAFSHIALVNTVHNLHKQSASPASHRARQ